MKKLFTHFTNARNFITGKKPEPVIEKVPVVITSYSQPHVLQQRMKEEKLSHDEKVVANLGPVRLERTTQDRMVLYFCPMQTMEITKHLKPGDGGSIPVEAVIDNLAYKMEVPKDQAPGLYILKNVIVDSNGAMRVAATVNTTWERIGS